jgi:hypothetical protein
LQLFHDLSDGGKGRLAGWGRLGRGARVLHVGRGAPSRSAKTTNGRVAGTTRRRMEKALGREVKIIEKQQNLPKKCDK